MSAERTIIPLTPTELESLIRRVVREELGTLLSAMPRSVLEDWAHEGPDDPEGDEALHAEALAVMEQHADEPEAWVSLEDFEGELDEAEARGELPR